MWRRPGRALAQAGGLQPAPPSRAHATPRSGVSSGVATVLPLSAARAGPSQRRRARPGRARQPRGQAMIGPPRDRATAPGRGTPDENRGRWSAPSPAIGDGDGTGTRTGVSAPWTARPGPGARVRRAILPPSTAPGKPSSNELGSCHPPSPPVAPKIRLKREAVTGLLEHITQRKAVDLAHLVPHRRHQLCRRKRLTRDSRISAEQRAVVTCSLSLAVRWIPCALSI